VPSTAPLLRYSTPKLRVATKALETMIVVFVEASACSASVQNLWAAILCHGFYDTIAFVRFASGKSRYAKLGESA
jgi:hypothetical protein